MVSIPIYAIHHDPQIYPSPDEFKPERWEFNDILKSTLFREPPLFGLCRFSPMEKQKRDPLTFIPFGVGKRNCIASELALTEIKLAMAHLVQEFRFHRVFETAVSFSFRIKFLRFECLCVIGSTPFGHSRIPFSSQTRKSHSSDRKIKVRGKQKEDRNVKNVDDKSVPKIQSWSAVWNFKVT